MSARNHHQVYEWAKQAAYNAVKSSHPFTQEQYFGDRYHEPIYTVSGLAEEIVELYYSEYAGRKPSISLFEDIAFEIL